MLSAEDMPSIDSDNINIPSNTPIFHFAILTVI